MRQRNISTFSLFILNFLFGGLLIFTSFSTLLIFTWGASGHLEQVPVQSLASFPPFCFMHPTGFLTQPLNPHVQIVLRSVYASFLHFSILHLTSNLAALWFIGQRLEQVTPSIFVFLTYLFTGSISMLAADFLNPNTLTAGASGAIFGLIGAIIALGVKAKFSRTLDPSFASFAMDAQSTAVTLAITNAVITFTTPGISVVAHVVGFASGLVIGFVLPFRRNW